MEDKGLRPQLAVRRPQLAKKHGPARTACGYSSPFQRLAHDAAICYNKINKGCDGHAADFTVYNDCPVRLHVFRKHRRTACKAPFPFDSLFDT